jgi:hypothetical protein
MPAWEHQAHYRFGNIAVEMVVAQTPLHRHGDCHRLLPPGPVL